MTGREEFLIGALLAAAIGLLIGLEREYSSHEEKEESSDHEVFAGIRTFPIISMLGYLTFLLADHGSWWVAVVGFLGVFLMVTVSYFIGASRAPSGATTQFTVLVAFLLGGIVYLQYLRLAVLVAVLLIALLAWKVKIHQAVGRLSRRDILAIIEFIVLAVLVFPLLPDNEYGPYAVWNPREIWIIVLILVTINFTGYLIAKFFGKGKGILITGMLGGFASSTAVAWLYARKSKKNAGNEGEEAAAILIASSIMFPRMLIWLYLLDQGLLKELTIPLLLLGTVGSAVGAFYVRKFHVGKKEVEEQEPLKNPLNLADALRFGVIFSGVLLIVAFARNEFGEEGIYWASSISGLTDVDAITISMAKLSGDRVEAFTAHNAIIIGAIANTLLKYLLCLMAGGKRLKILTSYGFLPLIGGGLVYLLYRFLV